MAKDLKTVVIHTDGACSGNPGPGGYGSVLVSGKHRRELRGGFRMTTNNRMEIIAVIKALETLKYPCNVKIYSDSKYLVSAITKGWALRWKKNGWMKNDEEPAKNPDLWERLLKLCRVHAAEFIWIKGHASNKENNRCDELAVSMSQKADLPPDEGYENPQNVSPPNAPAGPYKPYSSLDFM
jgi:ribonuclease HI